MKHKKCVYNNLCRKSTVECDDNFVGCILYVRPLNTLGKQWNEKCSYVWIDGLREKRQMLGLRRWIINEVNPYVYG